MNTSRPSATNASTMISHTSGSRSLPMSHCRNRLRSATLLATALLLGACVSVPPPAPPPAVRTITEARYEKVADGAVPTVGDADLVAAWPALLASCRVLTRRAAHGDEWAEPCRAAAAAGAGEAAALRAVLAQHFDIWRVFAVTFEDGSAPPRLMGTEARGRITGYYEPQLRGSRTRVAPYLVPLYRPPADLLTIDLSSLYPELAGRRLRGRLQSTDRGTRVVPYWSRAELTEDRLRGAELLWVDDAIEAFFLQVQGSGRIRLQDGSMVRVGYADSNGHPYRSIGRVLVERGEMTLDQASMQAIAAWARDHPKRTAELLNQNPSYVFFRELPLGDADAGPVGALGVPLTPGYSVAVDRRFVPLGAPVVLSTTHPVTGAPLQRLMLAQDTGGAIRGPLRFDFFWGFGAEAAVAAGRQRHDVQAWLLSPRGVRPEALLAD